MQDEKAENRLGVQIGSSGITRRGFFQSAASLALAGPVSAGYPKLSSLLKISVPEKSILTGFGLSATAQSGTPFPIEAVRVVPLGRVKMTGYLSGRCDRNIAYLQYLHDAVHPWREKIKGQTQPDQRIGRDMMLDAFRRRDQPRPQGWQGEYAGKWIDAAALIVGNTGDAKLAADLDEMVKILIECQTPDGYLGIDLPEKRGGDWDVWNIWYALTGLQSDYEARGRIASLEAARRGGEYLAKAYLPPDPKFDVFRGAWNGGCNVDVLDQVVRLYRHTGQANLLKLAAYLSVNYKPLQAMRASGKVSLNHAYVTCAYLGGQVLYAQAANQADELRWVESVWDELVRLYVYPTFSMGLGEELVDKPLGDVDGGKLQETCATVEWLLLNHRLYQATGKARYAHMIENIIYNALLGGQSNDGMKWSYFTPMTRTAGGKEWLRNGTMCCFWSGPRGVARLPQLAYHFDDLGVRADLFENGSVRFERDGREVELVQKTTYPAAGSTQFTVKTGHHTEFALKVRIPEWARNVRVALNGRAVGAAAQDRHTTIQRIWTDGDKLSIQFEMTTTRIEMPDGNSAVRRGPEVLSVDARDNPGLDLKNLTLPASAEALEAFAADGLRRRYALTMFADGKPQVVVMTPFAAAGNDQAGYRTTFPKATIPKVGG